MSGVLRGFDMFLNLVVDNAFEELGGGQRKPCGMIARQIQRGIGEMLTLRSFAETRYLRWSYWIR